MSNSFHFSLIDQLKDEKALPSVDFVLADFLIKRFASSDQALPVLLHLSQATRAGHLCIKISEQTVLPPPQEVWEFVDDRKLTNDEWMRIERMIVDSSCVLPPSLVTKVLFENEKCFTPICQFQDLFYFQKYWDYESTALQKFRCLLETPPTLVLNSEIFKQHLESLQSKRSLLPEQAHAIAQIEHQSLSIIAGGPGTGKTYTAGLLIKNFLTALAPEQKKSCRIALTAPTGKAAANLQKSLGNVMGELTDFPSIKAYTLHAILGLKTQGAPSQPPRIQADIVVVDECSMIDIRMMSLLLSALKPGARIILLGDPYQLPPVEVGAFFSDMTRLCTQTHCTILQKCMRAELQEIIQLSQAIKNGESQTALHLFDLSQNSLSFTRLSKEQKPLLLQKELWEKGAPYFLKLNLESHENEFNQFRILSPLRKGPFGVDSLNDFFYKEALKISQGKKIMIVPIMIAVNDPKRELFNGDVGFLIKHLHSSYDEPLHHEDFALFAGKKVPLLLLPRYEYAYCLSVHKSQGSEFNKVLLILPEGSERFGRELVYTAATRAKQNLDIWAAADTFENTIKTIQKRLSRFSLV